MYKRSIVRKYRIWKVGVFFLIFSFYNVYSAARIGDKDFVSESTIDDDYVQTTATSPYSSSERVETEPTIEATTRSTLNRHGYPTLRPRRENCTPPAIEQFPKPLMPPYVRKHGGLIIHVLVAIFSFLGLAIVCDEYFVSSLDRICEELKLSPDVAGATFMAAGSSAPELATVVIGVFFAKDDIGVSGVIGSAVFNIMFVISVCALVTGSSAQLNWFPLVRDCFFYLISILVLLIVICNDAISWMESVVMMLFYVVYCIALHFNSSIEAWAQQKVLLLPIKLPTKEEQSALVTYKNIKSDPQYGGGQNPQENQESQANSEDKQQQEQQQPPQQAPDWQMNTTTDWDPNAAWGEQNVVSNNSNPNPSNDMNSWDNDPYSGTQNYGYKQSENTDTVVETKIDTVVKTPECYQSKSAKNQEEIPDPLLKPEGGILAKISWAIVYPIHYSLRKTMVDVKLEKYKKYYPLTFMISMIWISFYSYFMVWMITIIGATLGIADTIMGLTFLAAGVSVPDALSSIAVLKEGLGDMAVSNAVGSNVFDILICLGLPWFIQTAIISPGSHVNVISKGLAYSTFSLLSTVLFLLFATHMNGWKLDKKLGVVLMFWYLLFITLASLYELNVFGELNPPECSSAY